MVFNMVDTSYRIIYPKTGNDVPIVRWSRTFLRQRMWKYNEQTNKMIRNELFSEKN